MAGRIPDALVPLGRLGPGRERHPSPCCLPTRHAISAAFTLLPSAAAAARDCLRHWDEDRAAAIRTAVESRGRQAEDGPAAAAPVAGGPHHGLHLAQVLLLRPDDAPRAYDAEPAHGLAGREAVVLHHVEGDERAGAAEAAAAVHGESAGNALGDGEEAGDDVGGRQGAVLEGEVDDGEAAGLELAPARRALSRCQGGVQIRVKSKYARLS